MSSEQIDAIRAVRTAAHDLANACAAVIGGTEMAISIPTTPALALPVDELAHARRRKRRQR